MFKRFQITDNCFELKFSSKIPNIRPKCSKISPKVKKKKFGDIFGLL